MKVTKCACGIATLVNISIVSLADCTLAQSSIEPDNTLGSESSIIKQQNIQGIKSDRIEGGAIRGANLFHSFREFHIGEGKGAYFVNPTGVENIFSRVTGNNISQILGKLGVLGNASLFLLNPNGIIFGKNASLDLRGSFVATTANAIQFGDRGLFSATNPQSASNLLTINPSAFFFKRIQTAQIQNRGSLQVPNGQSLLLLGGNVTVDNGDLVARGGRVEIGAVAGTGSVGLNANGSLSFPDTIQRADVLFNDRALADVTFANAGDIGITARNIDLLQGSGLLAGIQTGLGTADSQAGDITLNATGEVRLTAPLSRIENGVNSNAIGKGGNLEIFTNNLEMIDGAQLGAVSFGVGDAGNILISAQERVVLNNSEAFSRVESTGRGNSGNLQITTNILEVTDLSQLSASTLGIGDAGNVIITANRASIVDSDVLSRVAETARGKGGNVQITANTLEVINGGGLIVNILGIGDGGNININARDRVLFSGLSADGQLQAGAFAEVASSDARGNGGNIEIATKTLEVTNGAQLLATTSGVGNAGNIVISADNILFSGITNRLVSGAFTAVGIAGVGNAGNIEIATKTLEVTNGGQVFARTSGVGNAGNIVISADNILFSGITNRVRSGASTAVDPTGNGKGGILQIVAKTLEVKNGAELNAFTNGTGDAGNILVNVTKSVNIDGTEPLTGLSTGLFTSTSSEGKGGDIVVNTPAFHLSDGAVLDARTLTDARSGNITVNAATVDILNGAQMLAITEGKGQAGDITINASARVTIAGIDSSFPKRLAKFGSNVVPLTAESSIFVLSQASGSAGSIAINAPSLSLQKGILSAESATVDGGNILLNLQDILLLKNGSLISATAGTAQQDGNGGNIRIDAPKGFIVAFPNENSDITANAFTGSGGNINITTQGILGLEFRNSQTQLSDITASSEFGAQGQVSIVQPDIDPSKGLVELPSNLTDASEQIVRECPSQGRITAEELGSFTIVGRGGLPPNPSDPHSSKIMLSDWATLPNDTEQKTVSIEVKTQKPNQLLVEAQGWQISPDGKIVLVAEGKSTVSVYPSNCISPNQNNSSP